jgi:hypothetical protein
MSKHPQPPPPNRMRWLRQHLRTLKHNTDILAFRMLERIFVVFYVAGLSGVDGVVASHAAVVAREPFRAALAEDDVAGDYVLFCGLAVSFLLCLAEWVVCVAEGRCRGGRGGKKGRVCRLVGYEVSHTSTLLSTQSLSRAVLCRVGCSLGLVRGMAHTDGSGRVGKGWCRQAQSLESSLDGGNGW